MLFDIITGGLGVIGSVITILRNLEGPDTSDSLHEIVNRVTTLENRISRARSPWNADNEAILKSHYNFLIELIRANSHFPSYVALFPTEYGTWKVVRITKRKRAILRDPEGEY